MTFKAQLERWTAALIIKTIGCPERTAFSWKSGDKVPPVWVQRLVLDRLKRVKGDR